MKKILIRADDLGYSEAVNYGIAKTVESGLVKSAGLMPNMSAAEHGLRLMEGRNICLGQHTNICLGKPCSDPNLIPSLLDEDGNFHSSKTYRDAYKKGKEFTVLEEMVIEIEAQYKRYMELTGKKPGYFEAHAVMNGNLTKALQIVADKYGLPLSPMTPSDKTFVFWGRPMAACPMNSMLPPEQYDAVKSLKDAVRNADENLPYVYVCHPGYLDAFILRTSSLTINRTKEVEMLCDPQMKRWLTDHQAELISYDDIR